MRQQPGILEQVEQAAREDARRLRHGYVGVEHLFLTLLRIDGGATVGALHRLGQEARAVRQALRDHIGPGQDAPAADAPLTPRAARALEVARITARQENVAQPGEVHLLVAILRDGPNAVVRVFRELGLEPEAVEQAALSVARGGQGPAAEEGEEGSMLDRGRDLTALARQGELHEAIGRAEEMVALAQTLVRKSKNNPVLVGEAGVGKTAVVEGLAYRIARGDVHPDLQGKRMIELTPSLLVAGTILRGQFEERMNRLVNELRSQPDVIVFFDEVHTLLGAGAGQQSPMDAAQILKPALARGEIKCIGATTTDEYRQYIESDPALERRFQPITVKEPSPETTLEILRAVKARYEQHHSVNIPEEVIQKAVALAGRYIPDRRFPDKALDLIDQACARTRMQRLTHHGNAGAASPTLGVRPETVAEVIAQWTGRPATELTGDDRERLLRLEDELGASVIGQEEAVATVSSALRVAATGLRAPSRPQGVFLFLGPTGVGKTELAKELARCLFGSRNAMIRLDMSEFMEKHNVARLVGAPPGYVGHEDEGQLTGKLRTDPHSIVLLDEVEKAHPDVFDLFLQVFDDGRISDSKGRVIDCRDAVFILTSNIQPEADAPSSQPVSVEAEEKTRQALSRHFRPEFINRLDEIIVFRPLSSASIRRIAELMLSDLRTRLAERQVRLHLTENAWELLTTAGYDPEYGARPLGRAVERLLTRPLSEMVLRGELDAGQLVVANATDGRIALEVTAAPES